MDSLKPVLLTVLLLCSIGVGCYLYHNYHESELREADRINREYPLIDNYKDSVPLCGIVEYGDFTLNVYRHGYIVNLSNGKKFSLVLARNEAYSPIDIEHFLEYKDSIYYNPRVNGDSIFIFRGGKRYYFRLRKVLDKEGKVIYPK